MDVPILFTIGLLRCFCFQGYKKVFLNPNVAKAGGLQSQGVWGWSRPADSRDFEPSATQNPRSSGFPDVLGRSPASGGTKPKGQTTWQNRPHPSNSPMEVSMNLSFCYDIGNNCRPLSKLCHVVYATKGFTQLQLPRPMRRTWGNGFEPVWDNQSWIQYALYEWKIWIKN